MSSSITNYGVGSATYQAAGGLKGIRQLVNDFYNIMNTSNNYKIIREMHPGDLAISKDKLTCFLSGWMGGERLFSEKYGSINIPQFHAFIKIGEKERDQWLDCMQESLAKQNYPESLKTYLIEQLWVPAERIRIASKQRHEK